MKPKEYRVEKYERSIHMEPKVHPTEEQVKAGSSEPVKISNKAEVYAWPNGKIDVMFKDNLTKTQAPTLIPLTTFPFLKILHSRNRVNFVFSCSKDELQLLEHEMIMHRDAWFEVVRAAKQIQQDGGTTEEVEAAVIEIKKKGGFEV